MRATLGVFLVLGSTVATADDKPPDVTASSEVSPPADVAPPAETLSPEKPVELEPAHAPPGEESGFIDDAPREDSSSRKLARGVLFIPQGLVQLVMAPVRGYVYVNERYHPAERAHELFFNDADTFGVYPTIGYETDYGFRIGARLVAVVGDSGDHIHAAASTSFDGLRQHIWADYSAYRLDNRLDLGLRLEVHRRQNEQFYGVGNENETDTPPAMPIVIGVDNTSVQTHYSSRLARGALSGGYRFADDFQFRGAAAFGQRDLGDGSGDPPIESIYAPMSLVGFDKYDFGYGEVETRWDTRGISSVWDTPTVVSRGSLISLWGGGEGLTKGKNFVRYGADVQHYMRLGPSPRVLSARFHGEAITAEADDIPITELPSLGGGYRLRGYPVDRFRDRIAAVATLEYQWDLSRVLFASLFADVGRVYSGYDDLTFHDMRLGYGVALELNQERYHGIRGSIASSIDGGVFLDLLFEPVFTLKPRVERK